MKLRIAAAVVASLTMLGSAVWAADQADGKLYVFFDRAPTVEEIEAVLLGKPEKKPTMLTRGIKPRYQERPATVTNTAPTSQPAGHEAPAGGRSGLAMNIEFPLNSAEIPPRYELHLENLGVAMERNADLSIQIIGHADTSGGVGHNQALSERRAESVRNFLVLLYGIPGERIAAVGMGEAKPAFEPGTDGRNRRVEFYPQ